MIALECRDVDFSDEAYEAASVITEENIFESVINYRQMYRNAALGASLTEEQAGVVRFLHDLCLVRSRYFEVVKPWVADRYTGMADEFGRIIKKYS